MLNINHKGSVFILFLTSSQIFFHMMRQPLAYSCLSVEDSVVVIPGRGELQQLLTASTTSAPRFLICVPSAETQRWPDSVHRSESSRVLKKLIPETQTQTPARCKT